MCFHLWGCQRGMKITRSCGCISPIWRRKDSRLRGLKWTLSQGFSMYLCISYTWNGFIDQTETAIRPLQILNYDFYSLKLEINPIHTKLKIKKKNQTNITTMHLQQLAFRLASTLKTFFIRPDDWEELNCWNKPACRCTSDYWQHVCLETTAYHTNQNDCH